MELGLEPVLEHKREQVQVLEQGRMLGQVQELEQGHMLGQGRELGYMQELGQVQVHMPVR